MEKYNSKQYSDVFKLKIKLYTYKMQSKESNC